MRAKNECQVRDGKPKPGREQNTRKKATGTKNAKGTGRPGVRTRAMMCVRLVITDCAVWICQLLRVCRYLRGNNSEHQTFFVNSQVISMDARQVVGAGCL